MLELTKAQVERAEILLAVVCGSKSSIGGEIAYNLFNSREVAIQVCTKMKELGLITVISETENDPFYLIEKTNTTCDYVRNGGFLTNSINMESTENLLLGKETIQVLESLMDGNSYTITKDRPKEIMDLLPKLANLDIIRKTDRFIYGANSGNRQQLKKLIGLKSWKKFLESLDAVETRKLGSDKSSTDNQNATKSYILYIRTQSDSYNITGISITTLKYVIEQYFNKEDDFSIGGTKYFLRGLLEYKIYEFETESLLDKFLDIVKTKNLKSTTIFDEKYIGKEVLEKYGKNVSSIFLDGFDKKLVKKVKLNEKMIDIFISHSSSDKEKVKHLINILRTALFLKPEQIRCTSVAGYKLTGGSSTDKTLKQEITDCKVFIGVLTENSIKSTYVLFELGARWGLGKAFTPLVCEPVMSSVVKGPLTGLHCLNGTEATELIQLVEECAQTLGVKPSKTDLYLEEAQEFAELSKKKVTFENMNFEKTGDVPVKDTPHSTEDIAEVKKIISSRVKVDYPNDYGTQEYVFNEQMEAFRKLQNPHKEWLSIPEYENIQSEAAKDYPEDYSTRLYVIDEQVRALLRLKKMGI